MMFPWPAAILAVLMTSQGFAPIGGAQGVEVFQRQDASIIELIADGEIDAPPSAVQAVLIDYGAHPLMVHRLAESQVLQRSKGELLVYQRLKLPVVDDRDYTLRVTWIDTGDTRSVRFLTANDKGPSIHKGVVRMPMLEGSWDLSPIRDGRATRAHYHFRIDFGGSVPHWMVRPGAAKDLPQLFEGLRHLVASRRAAQPMAHWMAH
jgi:hypothetical protein